MGTRRICLTLLALAAFVSAQQPRGNQSKLEGVVINSLTGKPLPRALVQVAGRGAVGSDEDGSFRIAGLPAGRYYVAVKPSDSTRSILGAQTPQVNEAYPVLVYYPGTEDLPAAVMIDLAPGQQIETPFLLTLRPAYKVAGRVVAGADDWKAVNAPTLVDGAGQPLLTADRFDAKTGAFEFRALPAGTYTMRLSGRDGKDHTLFSN